MENTPVEKLEDKHRIQREETLLKRVVKSESDVHAANDDSTAWMEQYHEQCAKNHTQSLKIERTERSLGSKVTYIDLREQYAIEAARKGLHALRLQQHVDGYEQLPTSPVPSEETPLRRLEDAPQSEAEGPQRLLWIRGREPRRDHSRTIHATCSSLRPASMPVCTIMALQSNATTFRSHIRLPSGNAPWAMNFLASLGSNVVVLFFPRQWSWKIAVSEGRLGCIFIVYLEKLTS